MPPVPEPPSYTGSCIGSAPQPAFRVRPGAVALVVDDEPSCASIFSKVLERGGFTVIQAGSTGEALNAARSAAEIALMVVDVVLGSRDGVQVAGEIARLHPTARCLFVSGTPVPGLIHQGIGTSTLFEGRFLAKPFTAHEFFNKVAEILGR